MAVERDYFDTRDTVARLEAFLDRAIIKPKLEEPLSHGVDLPPAKEPLAAYVVRRRDELQKEMDELAFLQDLAVLMQKYPGKFNRY